MPIAMGTTMLMRPVPRLLAIWLASVFTAALLLAAILYFFANSGDGVRATGYIQFETMLGRSATQRSPRYDNLWVAEGLDRRRPDVGDLDATRTRGRSLIARVPSSTMRT